MESQIARTLEKGNRFFPELSANLYTNLNASADLSTDQLAARTVLKLVDEKISRLQLYSGWPVFGKTRFIRLLRLHREAISAEVEGMWTRADYFWDAVSHSLTLASSADIWRAIAASLPPDSVLSNADVLQERFLTEVIIDTHVAFYNGWQSHKTVTINRAILNNRADRHNNIIQTYIQTFQLGRPLYKDLQSLIDVESLRHHAQAKSWGKAMEACKKLAASPLNRPELAEYLIDLTYNWVVEGIQPPNEKTHGLVSQQAVRQIQQRIGTLQGLSYRGDVANRVRCYDYLSMAYFILSLHQARGGDLAEGMVDAQKCLDYNPSFAPAFGAIIQMKAAMANLKTQVQLITAQIKSKPGMFLNQEGLRLQTIANKGETPLNRYVQSNSHTSIINEVTDIRAQALWKLIGLEQDFDPELSKELTVAMGEALRQPGFSEETLPTIWATVAGRHETLAVLDSDKIVAHLTKRFTKQEAAKEQSFDLDAQRPEYAPLIAVNIHSQHFGNRPDGYLFFTRDHSLLKAWAGAAAIGVFVAAGLLLNNMRISNIYQTEYNNLFATQKAEHDTAAATVTQQYTEYQGTFTAEEALLADQYSASRTLRDEQYAAFLAAYTNKDFTTAFDAALVFLGDDSSPALKDPRRQQLMTACEQMLVDLALQPDGDRNDVIRYANELERVRSS